MFIQSIEHNINYVENHHFSAKELRSLIKLPNLVKIFGTMLPAHKILVRYITLDKCFRSPKKWTLAMLITHCSEVLNEKVSKRSIQSDIQFLRDNGAPIVVNDKKYYSYENHSYSILQSEITKNIRTIFLPVNLARITGIIMLNLKNN